MTTVDDIVHHSILLGGVPCIGLHLGLVIRELFLIQGFREEVGVFPKSQENPEKSLDFIKNYYFIEGIKYYKALIARDYLFILMALEKTCLQYIMQKKKHPMKLTSRKLILTKHIILCSLIAPR